MSLHFILPSSILSYYTDLSESVPKSRPFVSGMTRQIKSMEIGTMTLKKINEIRR
jgi:hypothetical protein